MKLNSTYISPSFEPRMPPKNVTFAYKPFHYPICNSTAEKELASQLLLGLMFLAFGSANHATVVTGNSGIGFLWRIRRE